MPWQRKYDFQSGTRISSNQVDEEFNQLIDATNSLERVDTDTKANAQMMKITADDGGVMINVNTTSGDILQEVVNKTKGMYSYYAINGSKNLPAGGNSGSIRGMAHMTSTGYGWIWAIDSTNNMHVNYLNGGAWKGWHRLVGDNETQTTLWTGALYVQGGQTITPTKKLSECRNGWILVWSDYDPSPTNQSNDYDVVYSFIPKSSAFVNGYQNIFIVPNYLSTSGMGYINKKVRVYDNRLEGFDENSSNTTGTSDVVLRNVLEW